MKSRLPAGAVVVSALLLLFAVACGSEDEQKGVPKPRVTTAGVPVAAAAPTSSNPTATALAPTPTQAPVTTAAAQVAAAAPTSSNPTAVAPTPTPAPVQSARKADDPLAPELRDTGAWINSEPFSVESQLGKVVLIDFWTYTCINCIRTFPFLREWHEKYADEGLVILGVHTPEFEFEKVLENVQDAVERHGLEYAVVQDNDFGTWRAYRNRFWPAKYLIDKDGYIRYTHFGEGAYQETEDKIRELLAETGADLSGISSKAEPAPGLDQGIADAGGNEGLTRELYAGLQRNFGALQSETTPPYVLHPEYYQEPGEDVLYADSAVHQNHFMYLEGLWRSTEESLVHARQTEGFADYIAIKFYATTVNGVMAPLNSEAFTVRLTMDDAPLEPNQAGADVTFDESGNSVVLVDEARMYRLVQLGAYGGHELRLSVDSSEMELFAFTFGAYETGP
ncbi:MAG: redoxin domain-containing protein [Chloroflexi bacterium]|nr:redoxin domain-containing protein [Chloroflexota bacterium]